MFDVHGLRQQFPALIRPRAGRLPIFLDGPGGTQVPQSVIDAMVGYRSARYLRFGWAAARTDDVANWIPARVTAALTAACAPLVTGTSPVSVLNVVRRDGGRHPSPNAGRCEAAFAAALGVRLGGTNVYGGMTETRPDLGAGRVPEPARSLAA